MGRKCSTMWDNKSCTSGYKTDTSGTRVLSFPDDKDERNTWLHNLPNYLNSDDVTVNMGICEKHWKVGYEYKLVRGGHKRPKYAPTEFGNTPKTLPIQAVCQDRNVDSRGVSSEQRSNVSAAINNIRDTILSWEDLCDYCRELSIPMKISNDGIRLINVTEGTFFIDFNIFIDKNFKVKAYKRSMIVNIRELIDSFQCKLTLYSQINKIITYLTCTPINIRSDLKYIGERFKYLVNHSEEHDDEIKKKLDFLCTQMVLHANDTGGHRYDVSTVRNALEIFLRSRNAYKALREYLILLCDKTLRSYFGKLGSVGSDTECKAVVTNVFSELEDQEKCCYITADEIYVKASVSYRAGHIIGLAEDQNPLHL